MPNWRDRGRIQTELPWKRSTRSPFTSDTRSRCKSRPSLKRQLARLEQLARQDGPRLTPSAASTHRSGNAASSRSGTRSSTASTSQVEGRSLTTTTFRNAIGDPHRNPVVLNGLDKLRFQTIKILDSIGIHKRMSR